MICEAYTRDLMMNKYWLGFFMFSVAFNSIGWWAAGYNIYSFNTGMSLALMVNEINKGLR